MDNLTGLVLFSCGLIIGAAITYFLLQRKKSDDDNPLVIFYLVLLLFIRRWHSFALLVFVRTK